MWASNATGSPDGLTPTNNNYTLDHTLYQNIHNSSNMTGDNFYNGSLDDAGYDVDVDCPTYTEYNDYVISMMSFWLEGVIQSCVCVLGLIGNLISAIILSR